MISNLSFLCLCLASYIQDSYSQKNASDVGIKRLGSDRTEIQCTGQQNCTWEVPQDVFMQNYTVIMLVYYKEPTQPGSNCNDQLLLSGRLSDGCPKVNHTCLVYQTEDYCTSKDTSLRIGKENFKCNKTMYNNSFKDTVRIQYQTSNSSGNFRMIYIAIKCNKPLINFGVKASVEKGNSQGEKNVIVTDNNDDKEELSMEKTVITIAAVMIGTITLVLIAITIIKRERSNRKAKGIELAEISRAEMESKQDLPYDDSDQADESYETRRVEELHEADYYQV